MTTELPKTYEPTAAQSRWIQHWESNGYCNADPKPDREPHTIMIPLPNVTGALHMGHCLNGTVQDLLTRWRRMQGREALWMPGTDHAGIATQAVVERRMFEEEGLTRHDIGRDALVDRIWKWKDQYEKRILNQLKQIGASCDWRRVRFTLDDVCSKAVRRTFFKMFCDGKIFRGKRLVNWDTHLQTAVADDEVYTEDIDGHFWTFNYPVVDDAGKPTGQVIRYSTTRPETMLGDTAVCVHPTDERYADLVGKNVQIPVNGRLIPIIADALLADKELGTGAVKVTPAHDPNDYACGLRNDLPMINIMNPDGTINDEGGEFAGLDRYEARKAIVAKMEELGHFDGVEDRKIPMKYSDRSKTPIEPFLSDQWFVKMDELAQSAMDAVDDGRVRIFPQRYAKTYMDWLGEKRDWCISRQLWWGHRIPIWSKPATNEQISAHGNGSLFELSEFGNTSQIAAVVADGVMPGDKIILVCVADGCPEIEANLEAAGFQQDPDVLDTWFSSALWPHATLGWPDSDHNPPLADDSENRTLKTENSRNEVLDFFYPGSVLVTSRDIITLWVARMVLTGLYNMGDVPFKHVYIHPKILDGFGQTMSKSKGNGVDPLELISKYGTDAVRFTIASLCGETQDVRLPIGYECPHCETIVEPKQYKMGAQTVVVPQTLQGEFPFPKDAPKPTLKCPKCKKESQFSTPLYDPDADATVARIVSERFDYGRNFCNKLWNACRFAFMNLEGYTPGDIDTAALQMEDEWILSRLATTAREVTTQLERYHFDQATRTIRDFTWNEFCDWYLEMIKPRLKDQAARPQAQRMLVFVTDTLLRLLHPFAPFITEELWHKLNELAPQRGYPSPVSVSESVMVASWPDLNDGLISAELEARFEKLQQLIVSVRNIRALYKISPREPLKLFMKCPPEMAAQLQAVADQFDNLSKTMLAAAGLEVNRPGASANITLDGAEGYIPLEGLIDLAAERDRLQKEVQKVSGFIDGSRKKLSNEGFVKNAPANVVDGIRESLAGHEANLSNLKRMLDELS
ncbi:MAG: valine--tRNA ligase [Planctomycetaceae bacterium]|nr:valine--tRNA ligase [Planctomycetaceae bacterium]